MTGPTVAHPRRWVVAVRLNDAEKAALERLRGSVAASDFLRALLHHEHLATLQSKIDRGAEKTAPDGSTVLPEDTP